MAININTPRMVPPYSESSARARSIWREEASRLNQEIANLRYRIECMERREQDRERVKRLEMHLPSKQQPTRYDLLIPTKSPRITKELGHFEKWTTVHEMPSVAPGAQEQFVLTAGLPNQILEAAEGHYKLYTRRANVVYLNTANLDVLAKQHSIRDLIWDERGLIELRCSDELAVDQILCVTEECGNARQEEVTQKKPVVH